MADTESGIRGRTAVKWGAVAVVLAAGYADLARGGDTIAPILLVIGYVILVPIAIIS
jgi:energy-converting hydrogenase Eha subunit C